MSDIRFQLDSADKIYNSLFGEKNNRYLLADEVGLGKTITAANVIAKLADKNSQNNKSTKIGYICGNKALAIQNTKKLKARILEVDENILFQAQQGEPMLSLGFLDMLCDVENKELSIHVLTPSTTIRVLSEGKAIERAYAYYLVTNGQKDTLIDLACGKGKIKDYEKERNKIGQEEIKRKIDRINEDIEKRKKTIGWRKNKIWHLNKINDVLKKIDIQSKNVGSILLPAEQKQWNEKIVEISGRIKEIIIEIKKKPSVSEIDEMQIFEEITTTMERINNNIQSINDKVDKNQNSFDKFKSEFFKLLSQEWNAEQESIINQCIAESEAKISLSNENTYDDLAWSIFLLLNKESQCDLRTKFVPDNMVDKLVPRFVKNKKELEEHLKQQKETIEGSYGKQIYKDIVSVLNNIVSNERITYVCAIKKKLQEQEKKKLLVAYYNKLLSDKNIDKCKWTEDTMKAIIAKCGGEVCEPEKSVQDIFEYFEDVKQVFQATCIDKYIKLARKCMVVASVELMKMDLFIADEIQNYSELFQIISKDEVNNQKSELGLVVDKIIQGDKKLLLMSATPFRYHSKMNVFENANKEKTADDNEDLDGQDKCVIDQKKQYLEEESDIFKEFVMIVKYLNQKFDVELWRELDNVKNGALKAMHEKCYKKWINRQKQLLLESNVSRVERYKAGIEIGFTTMQKEVPEDIILWTELNRVPRGEINELPKNEEDDDTKWCKYKICYLTEYDSWFVLDTDEKYWHIQEEIIDYLDYQTDYDTVWKYDETVKCFVEMSDANECKKIINELNVVLERDSLRQDYIKNTPALFSFKADYMSLSNIVDKDGNNTISREKVEKYEQLFALKNNLKCGEVFYNARVAELFDVIFDQENSHQLLFIPPVAVDPGNLKGVFKGKWGISKRLFFTDYAMTPKSLSVLITYEAARRVVGDIKEKYLRDKSDIAILCVPEEYFKTQGISQKDYIKVKIADLCNYFFRNWRDKSVGEWLFKYDKYVNEKRIEERMCYKDVEKILMENKGSPYAYGYCCAIKEYKCCCNSNQQPDKSIFQSAAEKFSKSYFKYMASQNALRVVLAYYNGGDSEKKPASIYDAIIQYGIDGCVWDVLDEYSAYIQKVDKKQSFIDAFIEKEDILNPKNACLNVITKENSSQNMPADFACGHYSGAKDGDMSTAKALERKIQRFNSPFWPFHFISTSIGQEGFDFHTYCRKVVHWSLEYNPVKFEQREGRVNRYQGYANRLNAYCLMKKKGIKFDGWGSAYENIKRYQDEEIQSYVKNSHGLFPDFVMLGMTGQPNVGDKDKPKAPAIGLERECYYYPGSFESYKLEEVLHTVGYYRSLLGQSGDDTFEEEFRKFIEEIKEREVDKFNISDYFINLYPKQ